MAVTPEEQEGMIDKIMELFQSNEASIEYGNDPQSWVDENLPDGAEAADVASCMPEVAGRMGGPYEANAARYNASHGAQAQAATSTVVNEVSYTYNTIYQQNAFIYAEEGAQVVNIQGDGNIVDQTQIDIDFEAQHPPEYDDYEDPDYEEGDDYEAEEGEEGDDYEGEEGEEGDGDEGEEGENGEPEDPGMEDPGMEEPPTEDPGWEDPGMDDGGMEEGGMDDGGDPQATMQPPDDGGDMGGDEGGMM